MESPLCLVTPFHLFNTQHNWRDADSSQTVAFETNIGENCIKISLLSLFEPSVTNFFRKHGSHFCSALNHWGPVTQMGVSKFAITGTEWLVAWSAPGHYLNQWLNIVHWTPSKALQWNFNHKSYIFIQENVFEHIVWKMAGLCHGLNVLMCQLDTRQTYPCTLLMHIALRPQAGHN